MYPITNTQLYPIIREEISGESAFKEACELFETDRWFSYTNFARTVRHIEKRLREIGLDEVLLDPIPAENRTHYSGWTMGNAWDCEKGILAIASPEQITLADWDTIPHGVVMRSDPACGRFEVVRWEPGWETDVSDRIAFTHQRPAEVEHALRAAGGMGLVSDYVSVLPGCRTEEDVLDHVLWEQVAFRPGPDGMWGFMISPRMGKLLEGLLDQGPVHADVDLRTRNYEGVTHVVEGVLKGNSPTEEILFLAHVDEPGANDNCSGAGLCIEIARSLKSMRDRGLIDLQRSIRFLWLYEGRGTVAWLHRHQETAKRLVAGINLDEIGIDQESGRSCFHFFLPPHSNPSFVGEMLCDLAERSLPSDVRWKPVADRADIILDTRLSDPAVGVPTPCLIQYPTRVYHTSMDVPEILSPRIIHEIGVLSACYALQLSNLSREDTAGLDEMLSRFAQSERKSIELQTEAPDQLAERFGFLRERIEHKRAELRRWIAPDVALAGLTQAIEALPVPVTVHPSALDIKPKRTTLAAPGGLHLADLLPPELKGAYRDNLLNNGLDLFFHHFIYWADGTRSISEIARRVEEEARSSGSSAIPRTTVQAVVYEGESTINLKALTLLYRQLEMVGIVEIAEV